MGNDAGDSRDDEDDVAEQSNPDGNDNRVVSSPVSISDIRALGESKISEPSHDKEGQLTRSGVI